ncbi:MAG: YdcF family protein [Candidatus Paceibacterota bacterium]|jgi:uncharacterized SAM-binding protein YcdF (DUF218 family)
MENNFDAIIVLGHGQRERKIGEILKNRLDKAFEISQENKEAMIILSGGKVYSNDFSEAEIMAGFLEKRGIAKESFILEDRSKNTFENLINSKKIVEEYGFERIALITSDYHLKRVKMIAKMIGLNISGFSAISKKNVGFIFKKSMTEFFKIIFDYLRVKICA